MWARALNGFESSRWASFEIEARDVARQIAEVEDWSAACRRCGSTARRRRELAAGLVFGDVAYLRAHLRTRDERAFLWGRLVLVAALLDGFCSESCCEARDAAL